MIWSIHFRKRKKTEFLTILKVDVACLGFLPAGSQVSFGSLSAKDIFLQ